MNELTILIGTAAVIAFTHTLFGPDHYLPFIVMSKARKWSIWKTTWLTIACGIGHVGSSIILGTVGVAFGIGLHKLEFFEGFRGNLAAWAFILFGLLYTIWSVYRLYVNKPHKHQHFHKDGSLHVHEHTHTTEHTHTHNKKLTPWILFTIFVLGPCEPLIPILMYPAAEHSTLGIVAVSLVFGLITIATMLVIVLLASYGISFLPMGKLERYTHVIAGATIFLSGMAIVFLGL
ncbi:MAG: sulfite exporter TauE/SafE family protein [Bacteroidetes bacterium]|nr:sulfite exporter TauE/SafE family protein [Bacteroidota bacterium]